VIETTERELRYEFYPTSKMIRGHLARFVQGKRGPPLLFDPPDVSGDLPLVSSVEGLNVINL